MKRAAAIGFVLGILLPLLAELLNSQVLRDWLTPGVYVAIWLPVDDLSFVWAFTVMLAANAAVFALFALGVWFLAKRFVARSNRA